jgi:acyl carrier protein
MAQAMNRRLTATGFEVRTPHEMMRVVTEDQSEQIMIVVRRRAAALALAITAMAGLDFAADGAALRLIVPGTASAQTAQSAGIFQRAQPILADHLGVDAAAITPDVRLVEDLGADELDLIELVIAMEEEFGVEIGDEQIEAIVSVGDMLDAVQASGGR